MKIGDDFWLSVLMIEIDTSIQRMVEEHMLQAALKTATEKSVNDRFYLSEKNGMTDRTLKKIYDQVFIIWRII